MANTKKTVKIEGTAKTSPLDAVHLSHRICIAASDGHTYEVEPSYVGRYLERFEGHHVVAEAQLITNGQNRSVVRILSLKVQNRTPEGGNSATGESTVLPLADSKDQILCEPEAGGCRSSTTPIAK